MLRVNEFEQAVAVRTLDFLSETTPWHRRLWSIGTVLGLREILEGCEAVQSSVLSRRAFGGLCLSVERGAVEDLGVGGREQRRLLQDALRSAPRVGDLNYRKLRLILDEVEANYLTRWADAFESGTATATSERAARALAGHLLDAGYSARFLYGWVSNLAFKDRDTRSLADILREAGVLCSKHPRVFEVLLALRNPPGPPRAVPTGWLSGKGVIEWLRAEGHRTSNLRVGGGILVQISARDAWVALQKAIQRAQSIAARVLIGAKTKLRFVETAWIKGISKPYELRMDRRGVEVTTLVRESKMYTEPESTSVENALDLLGPLDGDPPGPAIASGWAAVEALLTAPGDEDRGTAGDRLASLVACSFPRAELTMLAYNQAGSGPDPLTTRIARAGSNLEKCTLLADGIKSGAGLTLSSPSDKLALSRMRELLHEPHAVMSRVYQRAAEALRRLYRHRNLVLHWGRMDAVGLPAALRTAAPLVGAGVDRIAHGWFTAKTEPLDLAAKAAIGLELVGMPGGRDPLQLLE